MNRKEPNSSSYPPVIIQSIAHQTIACSKSKIETVEEGVKYV